VWKEPSWKLLLSGPFSWSSWGEAWLPAWFCVILRDAFLLPFFWPWKQLPRIYMPKGHCGTLSSLKLLCDSTQYMGIALDHLFLSNVTTRRARTGRLCFYWSFGTLGNDTPCCLVAMKTQAYSVAAPIILCCYLTIRFCLSLVVWQWQMLRETMLRWCWTACGLRKPLRCVFLFRVKVYRMQHSIARYGLLWGV